MKQFCYLSTAWSFYICSVLAWRIPGTGEPGGLPSMGSHRVGHDWSDLAAAAAAVQKRKLHHYKPCDCQWEGLAWGNISQNIFLPKKKGICGFCISINLSID